MITFVYAFLSGMFVTFIFDFFIFLGVKINYIDVHSINIYYNILFADNQNIWVYGISSLFFGYFTIYSKNVKLNVAIITIGFVISLLPLVESIGNFTGQKMFMSSNVTLQDKKYTYIGDIIYSGRKEITFYDYQLEKIITLYKKDLIE